MKKMILASLIVIMALTGLMGCATEADTVSQNISKSADSFEVQRRVVFINGITDKYLLVVEGLCSLGNSDSNGRMSVTCKIGEDSYVKHYLGISDNATFIAEQLTAINVDPFHYRVVFRPESIIPDIDLQTSNK